MVYEYTDPRILGHHMVTATPLDLDMKSKNTIFFKGIKKQYLKHPVPRRCTVRLTVGAHRCIKCHCNIFGSCCSG